MLSTWPLPSSSQQWWIEFYLHSNLSDSYLCCISVTFTSAFFLFYGLMLFQDNLPILTISAWFLLSQKVTKSCEQHWWSTWWGQILTTPRLHCNLKDHIFYTLILAFHCVPLICMSIFIPILYFIYYDFIVSL